MKYKYKSQITQIDYCFASDPTQYTLNHPIKYTVKTSGSECERAASVQPVLVQPVPRSAATLLSFHSYRTANGERLNNELTGHHN